MAVGVHLPQKIGPACSVMHLFRAASLLLMDINIYVVMEDFFFFFHNEGEPESCGEMMKWSVSGVCAHALICGCTSAPSCVGIKVQDLT